MDFNLLHVAGLLIVSKQRPDSRRVIRFTGLTSISSGLKPKKRKIADKNGQFRDKTNYHLAFCILLNYNGNLPFPKTRG